MKKLPDSWPVKVTCRHVTVTVLKRRTPAGNDGYVMVYHDENGNRVRPSVGSDPAKAIELAEKKAEILASHGAKLAGEKPAELAKLVNAREQLAPLGVTIPDATAALVGWLGKYRSLAGIDAALASAVDAVAVTAISVPKAAEEFLQEHKTNGETAELTCKKMEWRINTLVKAFTCDVSTIDCAMLQKWLNDQNGGPQNYEHNRMMLSGFFGWCFCHGYHSYNPGSTPKKNQRVPGKIYLLKHSVPTSKKAVFSPAELNKFFTTAKMFQPELYVPYLAVCCMAGLRTSEFIRLRWEDIDFDNGRLIAGEDAGQITGKTTGSWRSVKLETNLLAGLQQFKGRKGYLWTMRGATFPQTLQRICDAQKRLAKKSGIKWKQNAPRHSYISYRLVRGDAIAAVAGDAGNSPGVINSNYKALRFDDGSFIAEGHAKAWFAMAVPTAGKS